MATAVQVEVPIPDRLKDRPMSKRGFLVPWFVAYVNGEPDFRVMEPAKLREAIAFNKCWMCGGQLRGGVTYPFVVGPMCIINRISSEPISHAECARYAAMVCPFLSRPNARRREIKDMPVHMREDGIKRNPGVTALAFSRSYEIITDQQGVLFHFDKPIAVEWYCESRTATRKEVMDSIESGLPELREMTKKIDGQEGLTAMNRKIQNAMRYLPRA